MSVTDREFPVLFFGVCSPKFHGRLRSSPRTPAARGMDWSWLRNPLLFSAILGGLDVARRANTPLPIPSGQAVPPGRITWWADKEIAFANRSSQSWNWVWDAN